MNVIVSNKYNEILKNLNIEVIKHITGKYDINQLGRFFRNFYFKKMILDITSIINYEDINNFKFLGRMIDLKKVIIFLGNENKELEQKLNSIGIYNIARTKEEVINLINNSLLENNSFNLGSYNKMVVTSKLDKEPKNIVNNSVSEKPSTFQEKNYTGAKVVNVPINQVTMSKKIYENNKIVIGFKNITKSAGTTSLIYMLKKQLQKTKSVIAIEVNNNDFLVFKDDKMISLTEKEFKKNIDGCNCQIILVDLNNSRKAIYNCNKIFYLVEPSYLKINQLLNKNNEIFKVLSNNNIILNKCIFDNNELKNFENKFNLKEYFVIPPLNDWKENHLILDKLISKILL